VPLLAPAGVLRPSPVAARDRNGVQHRHAVRIRIFARLRDLADNVEWPVIQHLDADFRVRQITLPELLADFVLEFLKR